MLTRKSLARTAAATAGLALVATGALAPAGAAEGRGSERGQSQAAAAKATAEAKRADKAERRSANAERKRANAETEAAKGDGSKGRSATAPHGNAYGHAEDKAAAKESRGDAGGQDAERNNNGLGDERGNGHTPRTVCHALGNGGFVEITFDENAFEKHLENHMKHMDDHQDFEVEEGAGCEQPADAEGGLLGGDSLDESTIEKSLDALTLTVTRETVTEAQVLGAEAFAARAGAGANVEAPAVLGAEAVAPGSAAVPATGPVAGILPQTGAAPMALAAAAGLGLVGVGATMVARRRREV